MTADERNEWLARFSAELGKLMPMLSLLVIRAKGVDALVSNSASLPELAARACAARPMPSLTDGSGVIRTPKDEVVWMRRFAKHLQKLQGSIRGMNALAAARRTYRDARDLSPEEAACIYSASRAPRDVGEPGD